MVLLETPDEDDDDYSCVEPMDEESSKDDESTREGIHTISSHLDLLNRGSDITSARLI